MMSGRGCRGWAVENFAEIEVGLSCEMAKCLAYLLTHCAA